MALCRRDGGGALALGGTVSLSIRGVAKAYDRYPALKGVDLTAPKGCFLALLGPSGSGKTTLLRILGGLEFADVGRVEFDGLDWLTLPARERRAGFVFQHFALFRHMTVAGNIAFGLSVRPRRARPAKAEIARRVEELLSLVQLEGLSSRYPAQLSGGQRQRVALARALAIEPRILLLDEPFGALDAKVRKDLRHWLRALHERLGLTTVFVTHDQEEALGLADLVAVLNEGRIEQVAPPAELRARPASPFVADFLGQGQPVPNFVTAIRPAARPAARGHGGGESGVA
jgi:sulfate transport system ATP-binding protein